MTDPNYEAFEGLEQAALDADDDTALSILGLAEITTFENLRRFDPDVQHGTEDFYAAALKEVARLTAA